LLLGTAPEYLHVTAKVTRVNRNLGFMRYVTDPTSLICGQKNMAVEAGCWHPSRGYLHVTDRTIRDWERREMIITEVVRRPGERSVKGIIAQSLWAVQSAAWVLDRAASRANGKLGGRRPTICSAASNVQADLNSTTPVSGSPVR
jgi:hypothetical protein